MDGLVARTDLAYMYTRDNPRPDFASALTKPSLYIDTPC